MQPEQRERTAQEEFHPVNPKTYIWVWVGLILFTGMTVSMAGRSLGRWNVLVVLLIATIKSGLVLNYFMHLKYEKHLLLFRVMIPGILTLIGLFIGLTFFDVALR